MAEYVDVVIVGAGLSGIGAAHHLQEKCAGRTYAILEARSDLGGTWDLFQYPGVRSDSDMFTLGYRWRPWTGGLGIADGASVLRYLRDTAREQRIDRHIRFDQRVVRARWCSEDARWTLTIECGGVLSELSCAFLYCCAGYYRYDAGFQPELPGLADFRGVVVHPQQWPAELDHAGKQVVVIGSGATAVTLVPAMAATAARVTMLQRSPTYLIALPGTDVVSRAIQRRLPAGLAFRLNRWKNILLGLATYQASRRWPGLVRTLLLKGVTRRLPANFDVQKHFAPHYNPWDQRLCVVPNGDFFKAVSDGSAAVVTDQVTGFGPDRVTLASGSELVADIVVMATGLNLLAFGGIKLSVDGRDVDLSTAMAYKSLMLTGVPNFAFAIGYTNASWTLKVDLTSEYVCRLLKLMQENGYRSAVPVRDPKVTDRPFLDFQAGYVLRSLELFPKQGAEFPWRVTQNYLRDRRALRRGSLREHMSLR